MNFDSNWKIPKFEQKTLVYILFYDLRQQMSPQKSCMNSVREKLRAKAKRLQLYYNIVSKPNVSFIFYKY